MTIADIKLENSEGPIVEIPSPLYFTRHVQEARTLVDEETEDRKAIWALTDD